MKKPASQSKHVAAEFSSLNFHSFLYVHKKELNKLKQINLVLIYLSLYFACLLPYLE